MDVYLLRHGIAAERDEGKYPDDEERPLTEEGIAKMREAAVGIAAVVDAPDVILTSPLVRTKQTADIAAKALECLDRVEACDVLKPGATLASVREVLAARAGDGMEIVMLVGHEPDMGEIASGLIGARGSVVEFKKGAVCAIRIDAEQVDRPGVMLWHLTPKQLRLIAEGE